MGKYFLTFILIVPKLCQGFFVGPSTYFLNYAKLDSSWSQRILAHTFQATKSSESGEDHDEEFVRQLASAALIETGMFDDKYPTSADGWASCNIVVKKELTPEKQLKKYLRKHGKDARVDRKRLADLVLGVTVWQLRYHYVLSNGNLDNIYQFQNVSKVVRQIVDLHADRIDEMNGTSFLKWPDNAIDALTIEFSLPRFLSKILIKQYGEERSRHIAANSNKPGPITIRRNFVVTRNYTEYEFIEEIEKDYCGLCKRVSKICGCYRLERETSRGKSIWSMDTWKRGFFEVQDLGSQLILKSLEIQDVVDKVGISGLCIVDYCAGNGGKSLGILSQIYEHASIFIDNVPSVPKVYAHDVDSLRLKQLLGSMNRTGIPKDIVEAVCTDRLTEKSGILASFPSNLSAGVVLVDAPCSSSGVLRRRPSQRWMMDEHDILSTLPKLQLTILENASKLVCSGGILVYSTCSILPSENEDVANAFEELPNFKKNWERWEFDESEWTSLGRTSGSKNYRIILPNDFHECDGFFIARWRKRIE